MQEKKARSTPRIRGSNGSGYLERRERGLRVGQCCQWGRIVRKKFGS